MTVASLVVASNGATSIMGGSRGLRTPEDRERFLALRNGPDIAAILVGGASAATEPYRSAPHPLIVFEGGVELIHLLLADELIDSFFISRVAATGDGHFLDENLLRSKMTLVSTETINQTTFERYERASR